MASPTHPDLYKSIHAWLPANQGFYARFRKWLQKGGYSQSALDIYSCAARLALSQIDKPYWLMQEQDLDAVRSLLAARFTSPATRRDYNKGLLKLAAFLRKTNGQPAPSKQINWSYYLEGVPEELAADVRSYLRHCRRNWRPEEQHIQAGATLGRLTQFLRWAAANHAVQALTDLTPALWFTYLDERLAARVTAKTTNSELSMVQSFLRYLADAGRPICERLLQVPRLPENLPLPRDVPVDHLRQVYAAIEADAVHANAGIRRMGVMDRAWFLLMLHSGLRTGEVRRFLRSELDLAGKRVRITQSKGLKDRVVFLSQAAVAAIAAYLPWRGPLESDHLFVHRHRPLCPTYCAQRLRTYARKCGIHITPHQLRHSAATLLFNAGAPILSVQKLLGHKQIDTTLRYARLYDSTVAADYYRAMADVEQRLQLTPTPQQPPVTTGQLVALVDALGDGTLNASQRQLVHTLRMGLLTLDAQGYNQNGAPDEPASRGG